MAQDAMGYVYVWQATNSKLDAYAHCGAISGNHRIF